MANDERDTSSARLTPLIRLLSFLIAMFMLVAGFYLVSSVLTYRNIDRQLAELDGISHTLTDGWASLVVYFGAVVALVFLIATVVNCLRVSFSRSFPLEKRSTGSQGFIARSGKVVRWTAGIIIGLLALPYFLAIAIGLARGYAVQSDAPQWLLIGAIGIAVVVYGSTKIWVYSVLMCSYLAGSFIFFFSSDKVDTAEALYESREFHQAVVMLERLNSAWYFHLPNNYEQPGAELLLAKSYAQLGHYERALQLYAQVRSRYPEELEGKRAAEGAEEMREGLAAVAAFEAGKGQMTDEEKNDALFELATAYRYHIFNDAAALELLEQVLTLESEYISSDLAGKWIAEWQSEPPV